VVAPEWRRRGIARTFLETLEARAREVGIERFEAVYLSENKHIASLLKGLEYSDRALREGLVYMSKTL
ncbi:MAG: GNAT family N-acetyltransferase, partial [Actinomycetota bacterium]